MICRKKYFNVLLLFRIDVLYNNLAKQQDTVQRGDKMTKA